MPLKTLEKVRELITNAKIQVEDKKPERALEIIRQLNETFELLEAETKAFAITPRQKEVLNLIFKGLKNKEIAEKLFITEKSVKFTIGRLHKLYGAKNRSELITNHYGLRRLLK